MPPYNKALPYIAALLSVLTVLSCNSKVSISFPDKELGYRPPVTMPLEFSGEKNLRFDTARKGGVQPVVKKLDISSLPSFPYDSTGFQDFAAAPLTTPWSFDTLTDSIFNPAAMPSRSLACKTYLLHLAAPFKVGLPINQKDNPVAISDLGGKVGLPVNVIICLFKDSHGILWISSTEGLFRYDGEHAQKIIDPKDGNAPAGIAEDNFGRIWFVDQSHLGVIDLHKSTVSYSSICRVPLNNVSKMIKDADGRIWISKTVDRTVQIIDPANMSYQTFDRSVGLPGNRGANDITEDNEGNMWISTSTGGAGIINWKKRSIKRLGKANGLINDSLRAITTDNNGKVWIAVVGGGVDAVDKKAGTITHYDRNQGLSVSLTMYITSDSKGLIWMGKNSGLDIMDPIDGRQRKINNTNGFNTTYVPALREDNSNRMWVGTVAGLHVIDQHAATVNPLGSTNVISAMEDTVGNLWVATQQGIQLIDAQRKTVRKLDKAHGLANDFVQSFARAGRNMYVTSNGGLDIIDPINNTLQHLGKAEGLVNDTVYVVFSDAQGNTWFTGPTNGVDVLDAAQKTILHTDMAGGLSFNNIQDLKQDKDGLIWAAPATGGINVIDYNNRKVRYLNNQPGLRDTSNKTMLVDNYGRIWVGTGNGVYMIDKKRKEITAITTAEGLSSNWVTSLLPYKNSVIVGTYSKVNIVTAPAPGSKDSTWNIAIADKSEGLIRTATNAWATDAITKNGQFLWGDNGMVILNEIKPAGDSAATFITGLNVMTQPQTFIAKNNIKEKDTLWSGNTFYVKGKLPEEGIAGKTRNSWDSVVGPYNLPVNLQIPYDQNYLQFQFTQTHLSRQDPALYTYTLEGIDKNWSAPTANSFTENYLNLPPGDYTFKVASKTLSGRWQTPVSMSFKILPPWWQTWWAYTLFALLAIGALRMYIVYRSRKLQRENKLLEEKVQVRTKQLQQSLEDLKQTQTQLVQSEKMASLGELTAGIAHEIQNPLNFINNFADVNRELLAEMSEEIDNGNLSMVKEIATDIIKNEEKINHHGKRADAIVKSMLQHSRSNNNAVREPVNLNKLADEYLRLAYHGLRAKDKSFNASLYTEYDEELSTGVYLIPQDMGRVILNLITNAFYAVTEKKKNSADHVAGDKYEPSVWVITKKTGQKASLTVKDNGSGIPDKVVDKIFQPFFTTKPTGQGTGLGLSMAYDIVKAHGGELKVATVPGEGTSFTIELPMG